MSNSVLSSIITSAEHGAEHGTSGIEWVIGGVTLAILFFALMALVWFAGGREHS
ncbi:MULTISPECIES: hypothetical protein [unclassified Nocardioides]|jgi:hypothetical protein|uniref:hypothetical protein n=1 Tax=unclassified Nocardioides TaxID=2615069 RepID=UPI00199DAA8C|nr:hypothetical protein [Nocardioides sp.]MBC7277966.1 hypothetical protein [Nocardioides sp.]